MVKNKYTTLIQSKKLAKLGFKGETDVYFIRRMNIITNRIKNKVYDLGILEKCDVTKEDIKAYNTDDLLRAYNLIRKQNKSGMKAQSYGRKVCEKCGATSLGYAKRNHPDFRERSEHTRW